MPMTLKSLREQRKELDEQLRALAQKSADEGREFADDEKKQWDAGIEKRKLLVAHIERFQSLGATDDGFQPPEPNPRPMPAGLIAADRDADGKPRTGAIRAYPGRLIAFGGDRRQAEEQAYRAGRWIFGMFGHRESADWCREHGVGYSPDEARVMGGSSDLKGGALAPPEFEAAVIDLQVQYGVFRRYARQVPMAGDTKIVPRRTGGLTAYYVGENDAVTASDKAWNNVQLTARKLAVLAKYSSELAEDAIIGVADDLAQEVATAFAYAEDLAGFLGTGTSTYGGIQGLITKCAAATATVVTAIAGNTAFSTLDAADFLAVLGKLPDYAGMSPNWFMSKAGFFDSMARLALAQGGSTLAEMQQGVSGRQYLGYPVIWSHVMNATLTAQTTTSGLCYFGDLRKAASFGSRRGIRLKVSEERYLEYDQIGLLGTQRFDIVVHDVGDASVAGAIVMLSTPGS